jgi:hypothetical protein
MNEHPSSESLITKDVGHSHLTARLDAHGCNIPVKQLDNQGGIENEPDLNK